jgi:hypothetical protein
MSAWSIFKGAQMEGYDILKNDTSAYEINFTDKSLDKLKHAHIIMTGDKNTALYDKNSSTVFFVKNEFIKYYEFKPSVQKNKIDSFTRFVQECYAGLKTFF